MIDMGDPETPDYEGLKALAKTLGRPVETLTTSQTNDPFYIRPAARRDAEWFAELWKEGARRRRKPWISGSVSQVR